MGSATLFHLARRGLRVLGLERFDLVHEYGSSHGLNRIIRLAYWEHPTYVALLRRSYELWRELEQLAGERLLHITGSVDAGPENGPVFQGALRSSLLHERCDVAHVEQALALRAEVHCREPVLEWGAGGGRVWVRTARARYEAGRLAICAGPWAAKLIPELAGLAVAERQVLAWLQPS